MSDKWQSIEQEFREKIEQNEQDGGILNPFSELFVSNVLAFFKAHFDRQQFEHISTLALIESEQDMKLVSYRAELVQKIEGMKPNVTQIMKANDGDVGYGLACSNIQSLVKGEDE